MNTHHLKVVSVGYLLLPNLLFFAYWIYAPLSFAFILLLLYLFKNQLVNQERSDGVKIKYTDLLVISTGAIALTALSGVNGFCYQSTDYWMHNTKFYDLYKHDWPLKYEGGESPVLYSYYFGYYLVPALLSKLGNQFNETLVFVWTCLGLALGTAWLYISLNKKILLVLVALTVGDAANGIRGVLLNVFSLHLYQQEDFVVEFWSAFDNLFWVPNQVIPSLILGGMAFYFVKHKADIKELFFPVVLTFWWAVFPALAMGLLVGFLFVREFILLNFKADWPKILTKIMLPTIAVLPVLLFFSSRSGVPVAGFIWQFKKNTAGMVAEYAMNIGLSAFLFILIKTGLQKLGYKLPNYLFYFLLFVLFFFPVYRIGSTNDFLLRITTPFLVVLSLLLLEPFAFAKTIPKTIVFYGVVVLFAASFLRPIDRLVRAAMANRITAALSSGQPDESKLKPQKGLTANLGGHEVFRSTVKFTPIPYDVYPSTYMVLKDKYSPRELNQYLSTPGSFYETYLAPN